MAQKLPHNGYVLGLDVGGKRIGAAIASVIARLPQPLEMIPTGDKALPTISNLIADKDVKVVVVGLPRNLAGKETAQSAKIRVFAAEIQRKLDIEVVFADESLSSVRADEIIKDNTFKNVSSDSLAACFILEEYFTANIYTDEGVTTA